MKNLIDTKKSLAAALSRYGRVLSLLLVGLGLSTIVQAKTYYIDATVFKDVNDWHYDWIQSQTGASLTIKQNDPAPFIYTIEDFTFSTENAGKLKFKFYWANGGISHMEHISSTEIGDYNYIKIKKSGECTSSTDNSCLLEHLEFSNYGTATTAPTVRIGKQPTVAGNTATINLQMADWGCDNVTKVMVYHTQDGSDPTTSSSEPWEITLGSAISSNTNFDVVKSGLPSGDYNIRVAAYNKEGYGALSDKASFTISACENPPAAVEASCEYNGADAAWVNIFSNGHRTLTLRVAYNVAYSYYSPVLMNGDVEVPNPTAGVNHAEFGTAYHDASYYYFPVTLDLPSTTYKFKVKVGCSAENCTRSNEVSFTSPNVEMGIAGPLFNATGQWACGEADATGLMERNGLTWTKTINVMGLGKSGCSGAGTCNHFAIFQRYKLDNTDDCNGDGKNGWDIEDEEGYKANKIAYGNMGVTPVGCTQIEDGSGVKTGNFQQNITNLSNGSSVTITVTMTGFNTYTVSMVANCIAPTTANGQFNAGAGSPWEGTQSSGVTAGENGYLSDANRIITLNAPNTTTGSGTWTVVQEPKSGAVSSWWANEQNTQTWSTNAKATVDLPGTYKFKYVATCGGVETESEVVTVNVPYPEFGVFGPLAFYGWYPCSAGTAEQGKMTQDNDNPLKWTKELTANYPDNAREFKITQRYKRGCKAKCASGNGDDGWHGLNSEGWNPCENVVNIIGPYGGTINATGVTHSNGTFTDALNLINTEKALLTVEMTGFNTYTVKLEKTCSAPVVNSVVQTGREGSVVCKSDNNASFQASATITPASSETITSYTWTAPDDDWTTTGSTTNAIEYTEVGSAGNITATATSSCGATSRPTSLAVTVSAASVAGTVTGGGDICTKAGSATTKRLEVTGNTGNIQWQSSETESGSYSDITGETAQAYTASAAGWYRVKVTNGVCGAVYSNAVQVIAHSATVAGNVAVTSGASICKGGSASLLASGYEGTIVKWQVSTDSGANWDDIANTTSSYNPSSIQNTSEYRVSVNGYCGAAESSTATVTVKESTITPKTTPEFSTTVDAPETKTFVFTQCGYEIVQANVSIVGTHSSEFSVGTVSTEGDEVSIPVTFTPATKGVKSASIQIFNEGHQYAITATGNCKSGVTSEQYAISSNNVPYSGVAQKPTVSAKSGSGAGAVTTIYYDGTASSTGKTDAGSYTVTIDSEDGTKYCGASKLEVGTFIITKINQTALVLTAGKSSECRENTISFSTTGGSSTSAVTYNIVTGGSGTGSLSGNVLSCLTAGTINVQATKLGDNNYNDVQSNIVTVTFYDAPTAYAVTGDAAICSSESATMTLSGSQTGYTYDLYKDAAKTSKTLTGTGSALNFTGVTAAGVYTVVGYKTGLTSCKTTMNGSVTLAITPDMSLGSITLTPASICIGETSTVAPVDPEYGGSGSIVYTSGSPAVASVDGTTITALTSGSSVITATLSGGCGTTVTQTVTLTVKPSPTISSIAGTNECGAGDIKFSSDGVTSGATVKWYEGDTYLADGPSYTYTSQAEGTTKTVKATAVLNSCPMSGYTAEATGSRKANPTATIAITSSAVDDSKVDQTYEWEKATFTPTTDHTITAKSLSQTTGEGKYIAGEESGNKLTVKAQTSGNVFTASYSLQGSNGCTATVTKDVTVTKITEDCGQK